MLRHAPRQGFTIIEMVVAIFIVLLVMGVALPSITGQLGRQRLQEAFDRFDSLVTQAQRRSVQEGKAYVMVWDDEDNVRLFPADWTAKERRAGPIAALMSTPGSEHYTLAREASLSRNPAASWIFWPSGNCEPVNVLFSGPSGTWTAEYNPLSARGTLTRFVAR